jgi:hypothetical protein
MKGAHARFGITYVAEFAFATRQAARTFEKKVGGRAAFGARGFHLEAPDGHLLDARLIEPLLNKELAGQWPWRVRISSVPMSALAGSASFAYELEGLIAGSGFSIAATSEDEARSKAKGRKS